MSVRQMAGKKGNKAHANKTSFPNQKNNKKNPKVVVRKFLQMVENAKNDDNILSFQDACLSIGWRSSKVDYWVNKIPIFETLKKDIQDIIVSRINRGALKGDYQPASSIWRQKQLGEKDQQYQDLTSKGYKIIQTPTITFFNENEDN